LEFQVWGPSTHKLIIKQVASSGDQQASKQVFNADLDKKASMNILACLLAC
jgi:hypothetical protein